MPNCEDLNMRHCLCCLPVNLLQLFVMSGGLHHPEKETGPSQQQESLRVILPSSPLDFPPFLPPLPFLLPPSLSLRLPFFPPPLPCLSFKTKQKSIKDNQIGICYSVCRSLEGARDPVSQAVLYLC
ncbi:progesterone receptor membrane component 2, isoform CRA_b [Rattus norvegicus]|uniref:Progesterone receptor membrane component 2, isoform CRA_b n=1 Tax=Rattus norvegicus TaxID=10116 RepID=A6II46_RAT|nr:progesterone receptor membrane component 2, isoform CRA_b [Rattus norvegicus]